MSFIAETNYTADDRTELDSQANRSNSSPFCEFAKLCEQIKATSKKAEKSVLIASYFNVLNPDDLVIASRCLSGYVFPLRERRNLNISSATIVSSLAICAGVTPSFVKERLRHLGDAGEAAIELFSAGLPITIPDELTLTHVTAVFAQLTSLAGMRKKSTILVSLLRKASPLEAKYLVRIMTGDLSIGVHESDVEDAISRWKDINVGRVQSANMLTGDIGETATLCCSGKIDDVRMRLFNPVHYMHASQAMIRDDFSRVLPEKFVVEDKFDGIRVQVHVGLDIRGLTVHVGAVHQGLRVAIFSDTLQDITCQFNDLIPKVSCLLMEQAGTVDAVGVILDGVIVPVKNGEIRPFHELQTRLKSEPIGPNDVIETPVGFVAFDQLFGEGRSLIQEAWTTRAASLNKIHFDMTATFRVKSTMASTAKEIENILDMAMIRGSQGVVLKNPQSAYCPGRRGRDWLKIFGLSPGAVT